MPPNSPHVHVEGMPEHHCVHGSLHERRAAPIGRSFQPYALKSELQSSTQFGQWDEAVSGIDGSSSFTGAEPAVQPDAKHRHFELAERQPLRIHFDVSRLENDENSCFSITDTYVDEKRVQQRCRWSDVISDGKRKLLTERLLPGATSFFSELLSVNRVAGPLRIRTATCGFDNGVPVPQWMRDDGVPDADFVIFLTMRPINSQETVAFSGHCEQDQTGRPVAAQFNWAPSQMQDTHSEFMIDYYTRIAMHELTHSLVFTPELISFFPSSHQAGCVPSALQDAPCMRLHARPGCICLVASAWLHLPGCICPARQWTSLDSQHARLLLPVGDTVPAGFVWPA